jgi:hypothetical protein
MSLTVSTVSTVSRIIHFTTFYNYIFKKIPFLKLHPVIVVNIIEEQKHFLHKPKTYTYMLDYLPENKEKLLQIILGKKCQSNIRIIKLPCFISNLDENTDFFRLELNKYNANKISQNSLNNKCILDIINKFEGDYYLYSNNCWHFAKYLTSELKELI